MGKKAKSASGIARASQRKVDKSLFPEPPKPPEEELGSSRPIEKPNLPGDSFRVLGEEGYDDGGVADLSLLIDLDDSVQRRKRGDAEYFSALKANLLPRATKGPYAAVDRRQQKVALAQLLFSEADDSEEKSPSEVYQDVVDGLEDQTTIAHRQERLQEAKTALRLSLLLREAPCMSVSLAEICKRQMVLKGKPAAEAALRCAEKAIEIAGEGFYDGDDIAVEAADEPIVNPKYEKDPTTPGLANPATLKLLPIRVAHLCMRSGLLQRGNALSALGREEEARESYEKVFALIEKELRCARVDWERHSLYVNIGNSYSRQGDFEKADEQYKIAESLGQDHIKGPGGSKHDGMGMVIVAKRNRCFALKKAGREEEAKGLMKEVIAEQVKQNALKDALKEEQKAAADVVAAAEAENLADAGTL